MTYNDDGFCPLSFALAHKLQENGSPELVERLKWYSTCLANMKL
jgi:hypothetical protein